MVYGTVAGILSQTIIAQSAGQGSNTGAGCQVVATWRDLLLTSPTSVIGDSLYEVQAQGTSTQTDNLTVNYTLTVRTNNPAITLTQSFNLNGNYSSVQVGINCQFNSAVITSVNINVSISGSASFDVAPTASASTSINVTQNFTPVTSDTAIITTPLNNIVLPQYPSIGQAIRIKTATNTSFIRALNNPVEISGNSAYLSLFNQYYTSPSPITISGQEYGFLMGAYNGCTLLWDGSIWNIMEYYNGAGSGNFFFYSPLPASPTLITNQVAICDVATASKNIQLPNPAGDLRLIWVICRSTGTTPNMNYVSISPYGGGTIDADVRPIALRPDVWTKNACATFISDGSNWWIANASTCEGITFATQTNARTMVSKTVNIATNYITNDGFSLPQQPVATKTEYFMTKLRSSNPNNGIVLNSFNGDPTVFIGSTANNICYGTFWNNYTAATVLGVQEGGNTIYFLASYYSGF